jgi:hypothetical protein
LIIPGSAPRDTAWFACVGRPLTAEDERAAQAYLCALGCASHVTAHAVGGWREAEAIARDHSWNASVWNIEENERARLLRALKVRLGEQATLERLTARVAFDSDVIHGAATLAAARAQMHDPALIRCACGSAAMAAHEHALAALTNCGPEHLFMRKYRLFQAGRWPLAVIGDRFYLF